MKKRIAYLILAATLLAVLGHILWPGSASEKIVYATDQSGNDPVCSGNTRFAVIGDFGEEGPEEEAVANLVKGWQPDFIATVGDNNYPDGKAATIDANIGQYYGDYIYPYVGSYGSVATENRFFPALGNHDWDGNDIQPHLDYFTLPGNERYYDVRRGPVHLFIVDSEPEEPDGNKADSIQAQWVAAQMAASNAPWKLVLMHRAPYSSGSRHGGSESLQWDYVAMGATAVFSGHEHLYERLERDGILYFVNGLGGRPAIYDFGTPIEGSIVRYNQDHGAMLITAGETCINFSFYNRAGESGERIDSRTVVRSSSTSYFYLPLLFGR